MTFHIPEHMLPPALQAQQAIKAARMTSGHAEIHLITGLDRDSPIHRIAFKHLLSAQTYIEHRGIKAFGPIRQITLYNEFNDALDHEIEIRRQEALNKLSDDDRRVLGLKS